MPKPLGDEIRDKEAARILARQRGEYRTPEEDDKCDNCGLHWVIGLCGTCEDQILQMTARYL